MKNTQPIYEMDTQLVKFLRTQDRSKSNDWVVYQPAISRSVDRDKTNMEQHTTRELIMRLIDWFEKDNA